MAQLHPLVVGRCSDSVLPQRPPRRQDGAVPCSYMDGQIHNLDLELHKVGAVGLTMASTQTCAMTCIVRYNGFKPPAHGRHLPTAAHQQWAHHRTLTSKHSLPLSSPSSPLNTGRLLHMSSPVHPLPLVHHMYVQESCFSQYALSARSACLHPPLALRALWDMQDSCVQVSIPAMPLVV
jgi:hypothetical protein